MTTTLYGVIFWGIAFPERGRAPWYASADFNGAESWLERLQRRAHKLDYPPDELADMCIGAHFNESATMYFAAPKASCHESNHTTTLKIDSFSVREEWMPRLQRFCEIMDMPWKEPAWHLAVRIAA